MLKVWQKKSLTSSNKNSNNTSFLVDQCSLEELKPGHTDPDMIEQLKRCKRGIARYNKLFEIQDELLKSIEDADNKLKDL